MVFEVEDFSPHRLKNSFVYSIVSWAGVIGYSVSLLLRNMCLIYRSVYGGLVGVLLFCFFRPVFGSIVDNPLYRFLLIEFLFAYQYIYIPGSGRNKRAVLNDKTL